MVTSAPLGQPGQTPEQRRRPLLTSSRPANVSVRLGRRSRRLPARVPLRPCGPLAFCFIFFSRQAGALPPPSRGFLSASVSPPLEALPADASVLAHPHVGAVDVCLNSSSQQLWPIQPDLPFPSRSAFSCSTAVFLSRLFLFFPLSCSRTHTHTHAKRTMHTHLRLYIHSLLLLHLTWEP